MFNKSIFIAATLAATLGALSTANADTTRDHRCSMLQGGNCVGPIFMPPKGHVVVPPPIVISQPPIVVAPPTGPVVVVDPGPSIPQPPYHPPRPRPDIVIDGNDDDGITCREGRSIVKQSGFRKVHAIDCSGDTFSYEGKKRGQLYEISVNMDGDIVNVDSAY